MKTAQSFIPISALLFLCIPAFAQTTQRQSDDQLPALYRNIELTDAQQAKVRQVTKQFREQQRELQQNQNQVYTDQQRTARQQALRAARDAGKSGGARRKAVDDVVQLTEDQKDQLNTIAKQRSAIQKEMQQAYLAILTPQQRQQAGSRRAGGARIAPTHANVAYGPHARNIMDVWLAESEKPTPVFFSIHGGGFRSGNKGVDQGLLKACLDQGISVVAITYRLSADAIAPAQFHDSARAIQFVRTKSDQWNLDKTRFASSGGSAGAGLSLWLAFHDDLADKNHGDPVLRESTRLKCAIVFNGQTSYDPRFIRKIIPEADTYQHQALSQLYDVDLTAGLENIPADKLKLFEECSALPHVSQDDVPVLLAYASDFKTKITNQGIGIHHPRFASCLKQEMDKLGIECVVKTKSRRGSEEWVQQTMDFLNKHL